MNAAADAYASNVTIATQASTLAGRRFDLVLPFGCARAGALESKGAMRWSFDPKAGALRIAVDPTTWRQDQWNGTFSGEDKSAWRGFWITRPWSTATSCTGPRHDVVDDVGEPFASPMVQTFAIARMIESESIDDKRAYETVQRVTPTGFDPEQGFRLRIVGRVISGAGDMPIRCIQPGGSNQPPRCLIATTFTEVRIENPKDGAVLASWPIGDDIRGADGSRETDLGT